MKINLNTELCSQLRDKINYYQNYSITKTHSIKKDKNGKAWNKICAIMDRLEDTTFYLNSLDIAPDDSIISIFSFYNFMNHSATLIDCVNFLAEIYDIDLSEENSSSFVFNKNGPDKTYFEYLRSLCSVHPIETSRHKLFQDLETNVECSPFATWNRGFVSDNSEIVLIVYTDGSEHSSKYIGIHLEELFAYVSYRFNLLSKLLDDIESYYQNVIENFKSQLLKDSTDFETYFDYIEYLKEVYKERVASGYNEYFDFCKNVLTVNFKSSLNNQKLKKYQQAVKYSITFLHNYLQILPDFDLFETSGLNTQPPHTTGDSLFFQIQSCEAGEYRYNHMYAFEKLSLMWNNPRYMDMADDMLGEIAEYWSPYLEYEHNMNSIEITVFIHLASYFWRLDNDSWFNENIPNESHYR